MNKYCIFCLFLLLAANLKAQHISIEPTLEKNAMGNHFGSIVQWEFRNGMQLGGFYQARLNHHDEYLNHYEFLGVYFDVPIYRVQRLGISGAVKAGILNKQFVAIVPSFETNFMISPWLYLSNYVSVRAGYPAFGLMLRMVIH